MILGVASTLLVVLGAQAALGGALFGAAARLTARADRRRRMRWRRCWKAARPSMLPALGAGLLGLTLPRVATGVDLAGPPLPLVALVLTGAASAAGAWLMLHAGRLEFRGRLAPARREVRVGGFLTLVGSLAMIVATWVELLFHVPFRRAVAFESAATALWAGGGMLALGFGGFVALLAGLTGKPRPSGGFAVLLYVAGVLGLAVTRHLS